MSDSKRDFLYSKPLGTVKGFAFDTAVAGVFDDMISRSVPLYDDIQQATAKLAERLVLPNTNVYDLGCASGTTLLRLAEELQDSSIRIIGIDNSEPMLDECRKKLKDAAVTERIELGCSDLRTASIENASVVILNYTLQFLPPTERLETLRRIHEGMIRGGSLLLSEKVIHRSETLNRVLYEMHHQFKRSRGYSDLEIAQKRDAIENVLIPLSTEENVDLLRQAGFREVELYAKWYNFASFIAFRG
ncbi:MAG: carboxy-S-adenosyl-L-methionine synthase CmoA [Bdellovibrionota bacterium]